MQTYRSQNNKGFVILFAVLVSTLLSLLMAGVFAISLRQTILNAGANNSLTSLYAADSALECVLYDEYKGLPPDPNTPPFSDKAASNGLTCTSDISPSAQQILGTDTWEYRFYTNIDHVECTQTLVTYDIQPDPLQPTFYTEIVSRGFNLCRDFNGGVHPQSTNSLLVERRIKGTIVEF